MRLELSANARVVDLIEEGFDVGFASAHSWILRSWPSRWGGTVGAGRHTDVPAPARTSAVPVGPDTARLPAVWFPGVPAAFPRRRNGKVTLYPRLLVTDMDVLENALLSGLGIAAMPKFLCEAALRDLRLDAVLPDWQLPSTTVHIVYPSRRHLSPTVRSFIDHLASSAGLPIEDKCRRAAAD